MSAQISTGGMAEWSMAVVLKTCPIGYTKTVIFCAPSPRTIDKIWPEFARFERSGVKGDNRSLGRPRKTAQF
jgi:hypothetical protein